MPVKRYSSGSQVQGKAAAAEGAGAGVAVPAAVWQRSVCDRTAAEPAARAAAGVARGELLRADLQGRRRCGRNLLHHSCHQRTAARCAALSHRQAVRTSPLLKGRKLCNGLKVDTFYDGVPPAGSGRLYFVQSPPCGVQLLLQLKRRISGDEGKDPSTICAVRDSLAAS